MSIEYAEVLRLFAEDAQFANAMSRPMSSGEAADAGTVLHAWRALKPSSGLLHHLERDVRALGFSDNAVLKSRAFYCAHAVTDAAEWDQSVRDALARVRMWYLLPA